MKNKKNLMLRLTIASFALNIISIFLSVLNQPPERLVNIERTVYQTGKELVNIKSTMDIRGILIGNFSRFPTNILT